MPSFLSRLINPHASSGVSNGMGFTSRGLNANGLTAAQQAELDRRRAVQITPTRASENDAWRTQADYDRDLASTSAQWARNNQSAGSHGRLVRFGQLATLAAGAGGAIGAAAGGGAAGGGAAAGTASVPGAVGAGVAPLGGGTVAAGSSAVLPAAATATGYAPYASTVASQGPGMGGGNLPTNARTGFSMGSLLRLGELGAGLWGNRSAQNAQSQTQAAALAEQQRQFDLQQRMLTENEATRRGEADRVAAESRAQYEAQQRQEAERFRVSEDDRLYRRTLTDADERRRVAEEARINEAEARRAPRRAAAAQARIRLQDFLGMGG